MVIIKKYFSLLKLFRYGDQNSSNFDFSDLQRVHGFTFGDSLDDDRRKKWLDFKERLAKVCSRILHEKGVFLLVLLLLNMEHQYNTCLFLAFQLLQLLNMEEPWTLIIDDALSSSFVSPPSDAIEDDHQLSSMFWVPNNLPILRPIAFLADRLINFFEHFTL